MTDPLLEIPPADRVVGGPDPPADMNKTATVLGLLAEAIATLGGGGEPRPAGNLANLATIEGMVAAGFTGRDTLEPTGDPTGAGDTPRMQAALDAGALVLRPAARYTVNATLQLAPGGSALLGAAGLFYTQSAGASQIYVADGANLDAVVATRGWLDSSNTSASWPSHIRGITFHGNMANQAAGLRHAIVLQSSRSKVQDCVIQQFAGSGVKLAATGRNGTTRITNQAAESRIENVRFYQVRGRAIDASDDTSTSQAVYTDGAVVNCVLGSGQLDGAPALDLAQGGGWRIIGNHLSDVAATGVNMYRPAGTVIVGNYIDGFGQGATAGAWRGIWLRQMDATRRGCVVAGNQISAAESGLAGTSVYGVSCTGSRNGVYVIVGNHIASGAANSPAGIDLANNAGSNRTDVVTTGNLVLGWDTAIAQATVGTINRTGGV